MRGGGGEAAVLELVGEHLHPCLQVWFGDVEAEVLDTNNQQQHNSIECLVPDVALFYSSSDCSWQSDSQPLQVFVINTSPPV